MHNQNYQSYLNAYGYTACHMVHFNQVTRVTRELPVLPELPGILN